MKVHTRTFWCETCGAKEPMDQAKLRAHLAEIHSILPPITGRKTVRLCVDFQGGYENTYDIILPGKVKLTEIAAGHTVK